MVMNAHLRMLHDTLQEGQAGAEAKRWWGKQLRGCSKLELSAEANPIDPSDPGAATGLFHMSDEGMRDLKWAAASLKTSNFIIMMAAFQVGADCNA